MCLRSNPGARINDIHGLVDPTEPDLARFPEYKKAHGLRCHVQQGDALYVPSFWHHAVYSPPGEKSQGCRNIGELQGLCSACGALTSILIY